MILFLVLIVVFSVCGSANIPVDERIIGGNSATIEQYPYLASVHLNYTFICGGSIISTKAILTAAHCTDFNQNFPHRFTVMVGYNNPREPGSLQKVADIIQSSYDRYTFDNDISILILSTSIKLGPTVKIIPLVPGNFVYTEGATATVTGWGTTVEGAHKYPETLNVVKVFIISYDECQRAYEPDMEITYNMICAFKKEKDACQGDSGGPLVIDNQLAGIVSWGKGCARSQYPGVYTKVSVFTNVVNAFISVIP